MAIRLVCAQSVFHWLKSAHAKAQSRKENIRKGVSLRLGVFAGSYFAAFEASNPPPFGIPNAPEIPAAWRRLARTRWNCI
jgi:hypothetical protein